MSYNTENETILAHSVGENSNLSDANLIKELRAEIVGLKNTIANQESEIKRLKSQYELLVSTNPNKETELITKLNAKIEEMNNEKIQLLNKSESLKEELKEVKVSSEKAFHSNMELLNLIREQKSPGDENSTYRNQILELSDQLLNSSTSHAENISNLNKSHTAKVCELQKSLFDLETKNEDLQTKVNKLTKELTIERSANRDLIESLKELEQH